MRSANCGWAAVIATTLLLIEGAPVLSQSQPPQAQQPQAQQPQAQQPQAQQPQAPTGQFVPQAQLPPAQGAPLGNRLATSVGGTLTGRGGNFVIIDDPMKPQEAYSEAAGDSIKQWYSNTLLTRLDDKTPLSLSCMKPY